MVACGWYLEFSFKTIHAAERLLKHHLPYLYDSFSWKEHISETFFPWNGEGEINTGTEKMPLRPTSGFMPWVLEVWGQITDIGNTMDGSQMLCAKQGQTQTTMYSVTLFIWQSGNCKTTETEQTSD